MSGGVDSSVSAKLLKDEGHEVIGMYMTNWEAQSFSPCTSNRDKEDAQKIADTLGIDFISCNFSKEYREKVFNNFLEEYKNGRTPNPDIFCNSIIKFDALLMEAQRQGIDHLATGHYARILHSDGVAQLHKGVDKNKDQSYFLHRLKHITLNQVLFPLGNLNKRETRTIAKSCNFHNHAKKDSTGICFIGENNFRLFLANYIDKNPGEIRCYETDALLGQHQGYQFYTIGQRSGLGVGGVSGRSDEPWYVTEKNIKKNIVYLVQGNHPQLYSISLDAYDVHWIAGSIPSNTDNLEARIRHGQNPQSCSIDKIGIDSFTISFANKQRAVASGQSCVLYQGTQCLGGGLIA